MKSVRLRSGLKVKIKVSVFGVILLVAPYRASASSVDVEMRQCYRIEESDPAKVEQSPFLLCISSADTEKFPRAIVTVTYEQERNGVDAGRSLASADAFQKPRVLAKRYYLKFDKNSFGRRGKSSPGVVFDPDAKSVTLTFVDKQPKKFFYKEMD